MLRDKLEKTGKYRVVMTRTDDSFVPLADRVRLARSRKAQLFISIHCDALARGDGEAQGATIYTLSDQASDAEAARLADAENRADVIAGVDLSVEPDDIADILIDLAQRETKTFSLHFARTLVGELKVAARMHKHPLKSAGFRVLKAPDVPSVLIELGYVSNHQDLKQLMSDNWRMRAGDAIVQAVNTYFTTRIAGGARRPLSRRRKNRMAQPQFDHKTGRPKPCGGVVSGRRPAMPRGAAIACVTSGPAVRTGAAGCLPVRN